MVRLNDFNRISAVLVQREKGKLKLKLSSCGMDQNSIIVLPGCDNGWPGLEPELDSLLFF